ncbi:MAG TPA: hypothetical protein VLA34_15250, partial [Candidatus Krumholzibacterium sp.]|nr:hypothetical protein [Candidatus Krumholzibacterium sp.]
MKTVAGLVIVILISILISYESAPAAVFGGVEMERAALVLDPGGAMSLAEARALLSRAGVKGMLCYPPLVIAGYFPPGSEAALVPGSRMAMTGNDLEACGVDAMTTGIVEAFFRGDFEDGASGRRDGSSPAGQEGGHRPFAIDTGDALLSSTVPEEVRLEMSSALLRGGSQGTEMSGGRQGTPLEMAVRNIDQNSEFLIGSVLVNVIFPEGMTGSENWTDEEIAAALRDISGAFSRIQQVANWVDLSITTHHS